jgi:hypothetical protein
MPAPRFTIPVPEMLSIAASAMALATPLESCSEPPVTVTSPLPSVADVPLTVSVPPSTSVPPE